MLASTPGIIATVDVSAHFLDHADEVNGGKVHIRGRLETGHAARKTAGEVVEAERLAAAS